MKEIGTAHLSLLLEQYLYHHVLAYSNSYQDSALDFSHPSDNKLQSFRSKIYSQYQTLSSPKFVNPTAVHAKRRHTLHSVTNKRTEPSASADPSLSSRTSTYKKADRLPRTLKEEPRRTAFARETTLKVVLVQEQNALLSALAHQALDQALLKSESTSNILRCTKLYLRVYFLISLRKLFILPFYISLYLQHHKNDCYISLTYN